MDIPHIHEQSRQLDLLIDDEIAGMLSRNAVVALGVSGGKDSDALALKVAPFLDSIGHAGPKVLIHSDLGMVEHADSLPQCRRLAERLGWELLVVRRARGGMVERWEQRWADNLRRYRDLDCVTLITPWSSAQMRFCTGELKTTPITQELARRFPGREIINAVGIRDEESRRRAEKPVSAPTTKLARADGTFIGDRAIIREGAHVGPSARVEAETRVGKSAHVGKAAIVCYRAVIADRAHVGKSAVIGRTAVIGLYATVGAGALVADEDFIPEETHIPKA